MRVRYYGDRYIVAKSWIQCKQGKRRTVFTVKHMKPADETIIYLIAADVGYSLKEVEHEESI